jgi:outer membrane protein assembly factor BamB
MEKEVAAWILAGDGGILTGQRGDLPGAGEWRQFYADPANTSCSSDSLSGPMALQWFGRPCPRDMVDRHHRTSSPLYGGGRVFFPGNDRIYGLDAYNGTLLWERLFPARVASARSRTAQPCPRWR